MRKLTLLAGLAVGYVLGTRDGRERYEQIKERATTLWNHPRARAKASAVRDLAQEKAPDLTRKGSGVVGKATSAADRSSDDPVSTPPSVSSPVAATSDGDST